MFGLIWSLSIRIRSFLRRRMPTNILLAAIFTRRGLKWGMLAMLIAVPYMAAALLCAALLGQGAPGWVNILVLLCLWNATKFVVAGPISLARLVRVRLHEERLLRRLRAPVMTDGIALERTTRSPARVYSS
ncbi:sulfate permease [Microbacterium pumilum]|uniref:Sulfate permease n=1 Tax=Microbacterium pumilum TaxID=344165 RepID=A0ABN2T215_9MICO